MMTTSKHHMKVKSCDEFRRMNLANYLHFIRLSRSNAMANPRAAINVLPPRLSVSILVVSLAAESIRAVDRGIVHAAIALSLKVDSRAKTKNKHKNRTRHRVNQMAKGTNRSKADHLLV